MADCETWSVYNFCTVNNKFILGDNKTKAIISGQNCPDDIYIPRTVNGKGVQEIGANSFSGCTNIKKIIIKARITQINSHAFESCRSITSVFLPSSLMYIFECGIHIWNRDLGNEVTNPGTTEVRFERGSNLKFIGFQGISYRENIILYFCNSVSVSFGETPFKWSKRVLAISPFEFTFNGAKTYKSSEIDCCNAHVLTCKGKYRANGFTPLVMFMLSFITR